MWHPHPKLLKNPVKWRRKTKRPVKHLGLRIYCECCQVCCRGACRHTLQPTVTLSYQVELAFPSSECPTSRHVTATAFAHKHINTPSVTRPVLPDSCTFCVSHYLCWTPTPPTAVTPTDCDVVFTRSVRHTEWHSRFSSNAPQESDSWCFPNLSNDSSVSRSCCEQKRPFYTRRGEFLTQKQTWLEAKWGVLLTAHIIYYSMNHILHDSTSPINIQMQNADRSNREESASLRAVNSKPLRNVFKSHSRSAPC